MDNAMKIFKKIYVIVLAAVCALPLILTPLFGESESAEKRDLAAFPSLIKDGGLNLSFPAELDDWITDHFVFRSELITANNLLKSEIFATSDEDQVIVGEEDWLYFAETADDYLGLNRLSDRDIERIAMVTDLMEEYVAGKGGRFVFAVAPNKNTIYPEYMPDYYRQTAEATNLDRVTGLMSGRPYFADLRGALLKAKEEGEPLYHARDSHWNNLGAVCGMNAILDAAGKPHETYQAVPWSWERTWDGDLDAMIFPSLGYKDRQAVFDVDWTYEYTSNFHTEEDLRITTENADGTLKYGLIDSINRMIKDSTVMLDDDPKQVGSPFNNKVKEVTGYETVEAIRLKYVEDLNNGVWEFVGFRDYVDNFLTEDIEGVPNPTYPMREDVPKGDKTNTALATPVTEGTNLAKGATVIDFSGQTSDQYGIDKAFDGDLTTKWMVKKGASGDQKYELGGYQHSVTIDLGAEKTFNTYTLVNAGVKENKIFNTKEWEVLISSDGKTWTSVDYQKDMNVDTVSFNVGEQTARYVMLRVYAADNNNIGTIRLYDFMLFDQ